MSRLTKQFKQLKPWDYLLIILIVSGLSIFLHSYSRQKSSFYLEMTSKPQEYSQIPIPPAYWISNSIKVGDSSYDSSGNKVAEVVAVKSHPAGGIRRHLTVTFKVKGLTDRLNQQYRLNDIPLEIGRELNLTLKNTNFPGIITYIGSTPQNPLYQPQSQTLTLLGRSLETELVNTIQANLDRINTATQSDMIIHNIDVKPAEKSIANNAGSLIKSQDPLYKDVTLQVTLPTNCHNHDCFYHEVYPIKVGNKLDLFTQDFSLTDLLITNIANAANDTNSSRQ